MIDLAMNFDARRRLRAAGSSIASLSSITKSPSYPARACVGALVVAACAGLAGCSAQNGARPVANAAGPAVQTATVPPVAEVADGRPAESKAAETAVPAKVAALAKPVAIVSRGVAAAGRKAATVGVGLASWYGGKFHGRRTANGEQFDMQALTAAHPSLPLPSYVRVTNVSNGRSVVVRVNDRGPFHGGRLIDVSRRTADVLGFRGSGVGNVKVDYVGPARDGDDRKLFATYQEFGRPAAPEGMQMAAMRPVSEAELLGGAPASVLAGAQPATPQIQTVAAATGSNATPVGVTGGREAVAYARQPAAPQASTLGQPIRVAALRPSASASAPEPAKMAIASAASAASPTATQPARGPAAKSQTDNGQTAKTTPEKVQTEKSQPGKSELARVESPAPVKRVVRTAEPVLASTTPAFAEASPAPAATSRGSEKSQVSQRIAASFDGFDAFPAAAAAGADAFGGLR